MAAMLAEALAARPRYGDVMGWEGKSTKVLYLGGVDTIDHHDFMSRVH